MHYRRIICLILGLWLGVRVRPRSRDRFRANQKGSENQFRAARIVGLGVQSHLHALPPNYLSDPGPVAGCAGSATITRSLSRESEGIRKPVSCCANSGTRGTITSSCTTAELSV